MTSRVIRHFTETRTTWNSNIKILYMKSTKVTISIITYLYSKFDICLGVTYNQCEGRDQMPATMEDYLIRSIKPQIAAFISFLGDREYGARECWHDWYEAVYVLDGGIQKIVNQQTFHLRPGDLIIVEPLDVHTLISVSEDTALLVLLFTAGSLNLNDYSDARSRYLDVFIGNLTVEPLILRPPYASQENIRLTLERMSQAYCLKEPGYQMLLRGLLYQFIAHIEQNGRLLLPNERNPQGGIQLSKICQYVERHVRTHLTVEKVAAGIGYSTAYLSRYFKRITGKNIKEFIDYVKTNEAELILQYEDIAIKELSSMLGFRNSSNFSRTFKRLKGYTPSSVRVQTR